MAIFQVFSALFGDFFFFSFLFFLSWRYSWFSGSIWLLPFRSDID